MLWLYMHALHTSEDNAYTPKEPYLQLKFPYEPGVFIGCPLVSDTEAYIVRWVSLLRLGYLVRVETQNGKPALNICFCQDGELPLSRKRPKLEQECLKAGGPS